MCRTRADDIEAVESKMSSLKPPPVSGWMFLWWGGRKVRRMDLRGWRGSKDAKLADGAELMDSSPLSSLFRRQLEPTQVQNRWLLLVVQWRRLMMMMLYELMWRFTFHDLRLALKTSLLNKKMNQINFSGPKKSESTTRNLHQEGSTHPGRLKCNT